MRESHLDGGRTRMWRLDSVTPASWVTRIESDLAAFLSDHAQCELGAAASARSMIRCHRDDAALIERLRGVERDEEQHLTEVQALLAARGMMPKTTRVNPYVIGLHSLLRNGARERQLDRLLVSSLIEARSLERFHLMSEHLADRELATFYRSLMSSEAGHRALFVELARERHPADRVSARLIELRAAEARLLASLPFDHRVHSGIGTRAES